jgi:P2 family phage contractile tail tube protein
MLGGRMLKNFNLFVDRAGYAGRIDEITLPKLTLKTEEYRGGGMDVPVEIDMGMEKMECDFTLSEYSPDVLRQFGLAPGNDVPLNIRGATQDAEGDVYPVLIEIKGIWKEIDMGNWKTGDKATMKVQVACRYYSYSEDGAQLIKIDMENMERVIDGVDQLEKIRGAIKL